jgi:hypothetical protein
MAEKYIKELGELEKLKKEMELLKKEKDIKKQIMEKSKEIRMLSEELHPTAQAKLKKFLALTDKALSKVGELGVKGGTQAVKKLIAYEKKQKALKRGK